MLRNDAEGAVFGTAEDPEVAFIEGEEVVSDAESEAETEEIPG